jgi:hypothetical protein
LFLRWFLFLVGHIDCSLHFRIHFVVCGNRCLFILYYTFQIQNQF